MKHTFSATLSRMALIVPVFFVGCLSGSEEQESSAPADEPVGTAQEAIVVSGMGHYCSGTYPDNIGWSFISDTNGNDPCASIVSTGGTVKRKGLYANNAPNRVVYRCYPPNYGWVGIYEGTGNAPLTAAYNAAHSLNLPGCIFTVSPTAMPVFDSPFPLTTTVSHGSGFDFAKGSYGTLDVADFGQVGSTAATIVDFMGRDKSGSGAIDNHDGHDWGMARGTDIRAVADGTVVMARSWDSGATGSDSPFQNEVAIVHTVRGTAGSSYKEQFLTYYAHLQSFSVTVGQTVLRGQQIGESGNTGSSSGPHLHFGVARLTNIADSLLENINFFSPPNHSDGTDQQIEPYGWAAPQGFDPWAWQSYPDGALSVNLWRSGQAPPLGTW